MAQDWKTPRREPACRACERAFADGEAHFSSLAIQAGELVREDLCAACWKARAADRAPAAGETPAAPEPPQAAAESPSESTAAVADASSGSDPAAVEVLVWWRTRHEAERKRARILDVDLLEQLFRSLAERGEQNLRELRYLLCLLLMRKRRLKVVRVLRAGEEGAETESFLCRRPRTGEEFRVAVFDFSRERADELRDELHRLLDGVDPDELDQEDPAEPSAEGEGRGASGSAPETADAGPADAADGDPKADDAALPTARS